MSLLYYMFQSILNTFAFGYFFGVKKLIIFTDGGYPRGAHIHQKIKLIIFAEIFAKGGEKPSIRVNNYLFPTKQIPENKSVQNALKHVIQ